ncbi:hypothetical protein CY652_06145 [Burkholderia sp. WAC0059]|uniref:TadE/TadG family type IV pilus assembly protein n=1 Tax=Burkholderia sp. WAC0059 TaxID=2066022 RepID=UPI000C7E8B8E|nr:TadE/TadG family type IV pilus assembly protein [Burkholderia sp. WAC0059]PLZ03383.1 hypothetical protein CY652_06145 [Burkholderia sp. WAC0059]
MLRLLRFLRSLLASRRGTAATEFAILMPVMATILFAVFELSQIVRAQMKLENAAQSIADLVSQQIDGVTGGTNGSLGNFCKAGALMMTPFSVGADSASFTIAVASVTNQGGAAQDWQSDDSCGSNATAISSVSLARGLVPSAGDSVIVVQASYLYNSPIQYLFPGLFTLTHVAFARPRGNAAIACTASCS